MTLLPASSGAKDIASTLAHFLSDYQKSFNMSNQQLSLKSLAFSHKGHIPPRYSCEGENISPPLVIENIPDKTKTLALIVEDHDAPRGIFDHWLAWNISPNEAIGEGANPGISGTNSFGNTGYGGPCPPSGEHRYFFKVFALDTQLDLSAGADKKALLEAMKDHVLAECELVGLYKKKNQPVTAK